MKHISHLPLLFTILFLFNCGSQTYQNSLIQALLEDPSSQPNIDNEWEIKTATGEYILPDIFYAESTQVDQLMPIQSSVENNNSYSINRLIYPTLGNPNLYVKQDSSDALYVVLRLEEQLLQPNATNINAYLLPKDERLSKLYSNLLIHHDAGKIVPSAIKVHNKTGVAELDQRRTVQLIFNQSALSKIPSGFYDLRIEVTANNKLVEKEFQFNAVKVIDEKITDDTEYYVLNVTDSQVSVGKSFTQRTAGFLEKFVEHVNACMKSPRCADKRLKKSMFITFNGDLHNGGSPETLTPESVATTYFNEANRILNILKELEMPIYLTAGNHDGYVSFGHIAPAFNTVKKSVEELAQEVNPKRANEFLDLMSKTEETKGFYVDIFQGQFIRRGEDKAASTVAQSWKKTTVKNFPLYDGFNYWRKTYGPLHYSFTFGKNHYVVLNSFDLRQHRRNGWGMYTVNYGGGMSQFQMDWMKKDVELNANKDVILLAHHDPRGGHNGKDYPYYFKQVDFKGMKQSALNYLKGEIICKFDQEWMTEEMQLKCMHDGLQEWMRPDGDYDCNNKYLLPSGKCDMELIGKSTEHHLNYSGYNFIDFIATHPSIKTILLGHTHYNSAELYQKGHELIPGRVSLDKDTINKILKSRDEVVASEGFTEKDDGQLIMDLAARGHKFQRSLQPENNNTKRELAILRLTSVAQLTSQVNAQSEDPMFGFSVLQMNKSLSPSENADNVKLRRIFYYQFKKKWSDGTTGFGETFTLNLDRNASYGKDDQANPLVKMNFFKMK